MINYSRIKQLKPKIKLVLFLTALTLTLISLTLWFLWEVPLLTPLSPYTTFGFLNGENSVISKSSSSQVEKVIYGFLPYWNINKVSVQPEITHLSYFGLEIGPDGNILTENEEGINPGYSKLNSDRVMELANQVKNNEDQIEIVLAQFDAQNIREIVNNTDAHQNLITSLDSILLAYPISGINIDIEYVGNVTPELRDDLTLLIKTVRNHLNQKYDGIKLSIDMYASAASRDMIWDVSAIAEHVDWIIVMAYDFHRRSSTQAGPVAPLFGGKEFWESDINQYLRNFLKKAPREKILLGIPFYGYQWQTDSRDSQANTYPESGSTVRIVDIERILEDKEKLKVETHWHKKALTPYLSYIENEETYVAYFENSRSISYKLEYVKQLDLAGIAIWALGYEGDSRELWQTINQRLQ